MKQLSICLATYNRSALLGRTVDALARQITALDNPDLVEVLIGDNHSTDATPTVAAEAAARWNFVRHVRHEKNLGGEGNWSALVDMAEGRFVWLFADDDYILEGCVARVLHAIDRHPDIGYLFVNYELWDETRKLVHAPSFCVAQQDCIVDSVEALYRETRFAGSFIGANVFQKESYLRAGEPWHFRTLWPHLYLACKLVASQSGYVIARPLLRMGCYPRAVTYDYQKDQGRSHFHLDAQMMYMDFARHVESLLSAESIRLLDREILENNRFQIEHYREMSPRYEWSYVWTTYRRLVRFRAMRQSPRFWLVYVPILFMPGSAFRAYWAYRQMRHALPNWESSPSALQRTLYRMYRALRTIKRRMLQQPA